MDERVKDEFYDGAQKCQ